MDANIHGMPDHQLISAVNTILETYTVGEVLEAIKHLYSGVHQYDTDLGVVDYHILKIEHDFDGNQIKQKINEDLASDLATILINNGWNNQLVFNDENEMVKHLKSKNYEVKPILTEFYYKIESPINLLGFYYSGTVCAKNYEDAFKEVKKLIQNHIDIVSKQVGNYIEITLDAFTIKLN